MCIVAPRSSYRARERAGKPVFHAYNLAPLLDSVPPPPRDDEQEDKTQMEMWQVCTSGA